VPIRPPSRRSRIGTAATLLLGAFGALLMTASAWRTERLPTLLANAPARAVGVSWYADDAWVPDAAMQVERSPSIVLLIHGLDEPGGIWDALAPALSENGHAVARFDYPNDQPVRDSADELADALVALHDSGVTETRIVAHSMGGLVTRDTLTRPELADRIRVRVPLLVTLGTPHAGSPWARWQPIAEAREQIQRWFESGSLDPAVLFGWNADGMGEAGEDLRPGSAFLTDLNSRPHPAGTRVACVIAVIPNLPEGTAIENIPDYARALGDGVVPTDSGVYAHADSVHLVRANHRSMIRPVELGEWIQATFGPAFSADPPPTPPGIPIVLELLADPDSEPEAAPEPSQTPP